MLRYLQPGVETNHFYRRGEVLPIQPPPHSPQPGSELNNMLQTINVTLSDIQVQLCSIKDQNVERDATLKQLEKDIKDIKESRRSANDGDGSQSKKSRKVHVD